MESPEDKELHNQMVLKMDEYSRKVPQDEDFSRFIFTILSKEHSDLALHFIKEHSIKYLYYTYPNRPEYTPLMIAVESELSDIVEEIMHKIKYEACIYCKEQIKNLQNEMLTSAFSGLDVSSSRERSLYSSFAKINIGDSSLDTKINYFQNIIVELEKGGDWPNYEFLRDIQNKTGYFKALEISKIKNSITKTINDINDIFKNYDNKVILGFLSTCPSGKCWSDIDKITKKIPQRRKEISGKEKEMKAKIRSQKERRQKSISEKRSRRNTEEEEIDFGNGRRKSTKRKSYSRKKCRRGSISRRGYTYIKKSNRKKYRVKSTCVKSKGIRSKGKKSKRVLPSLRKGALTKYGYSLSNTEMKRHTALKKALKVYGYSSLVKKLNAVKLLTKNTSPKNSKIYGKDLKWIQKLNKSN